MPNKAKVSAPKSAQTGIGITHHATGAPIKGLQPESITAKPTRHMLQRIAKMGKHPGTGLVYKRWHLYKPGFTLQHAKQTPGLVVSDITFWAKVGLLTLRQCTDAEYNAAVAAWEKGKGRTTAPALKPIGQKPAKGTGKPAQAQKAKGKGKAQAKANKPAKATPKPAQATTPAQGAQATPQAATPAQAAPAQAQAVITATGQATG